MGTQLCVTFLIGPFGPFLLSSLHLYQEDPVVYNQRGGGSGRIRKDSQQEGAWVVQRDGDRMILLKSSHYVLIIHTIQIKVKEKR